MNDIAFVWVRGIEGVRLFNTRTLKQVIPNRFHLHAIERMQHRYYVTLLVRGESSAEIYIKNWPFRLKEQMSHKTLVPYLNIAHEEMLDSVNPNHSKHAAWVISVDGHPVDDSSLIKYLEL
ncbi:MAG TPA: hypothetical protein VFD12_10925 [Oligella sp.]|nr:hypothetical protein [Oligella sp.]